MYFGLRVKYVLISRQILSKMGTCRQISLKILSMKFSRNVPIFSSLITNQETGQSESTKFFLLISILEFLISVAKFSAILLYHSVFQILMFRPFTGTQQINGAFAFRNFRRKSNFAQVGNPCIHNQIHTNKKRQYGWNRNSSKLVLYQQQHEHPIPHTSSAIAQQYSSDTFFALRFQSHKEKYGPH